jgi:hypothetical protein
MGRYCLGLSFCLSCVRKFVFIGAGWGIQSMAAIFVLCFSCYEYVVRRFGYDVFKTMVLVYSDGGYIGVYFNHIIEIARVLDSSLWPNS